MEADINLAWQLSSRQAILLRCWEDACVCYASPSGDTHLLPVPQGLLLQRLERGPCLPPELAGFLEEAIDLPLGVADEAIPEMLSELGALKLIEPASP
jgi:PqqD family protein of HPr-rel-A system